MGDFAPADHTVIDGVEVKRYGAGNAADANMEDVEDVERNEDFGWMAFDVFNKEVRQTLGLKVVDQDLVVLGLEFF